MIRLPTKKQFCSILESFPDRFRPAFFEISEGKRIIEVFEAHKIPPITGQWNCYKWTSKFFGVPVSPKQLQVIILLRRLVDGEDEVTLKEVFSKSCVAHAKVIGFDHAVGKNKKITVDLDRIGVHSYRYAKKHKLPYKSFLRRGQRISCTAPDSR